jgi:hypothetical protein
MLIHSLQNKTRFKLKYLLNKKRQTKKTFRLSLRLGAGLVAVVDLPKAPIGTDVVSDEVGTQPSHPSPLHSGCRLQPFAMK